MYKKKDNKFGDDMYGLLTKREVKMAGYWPSSFFACLCTETKSRPLTRKKGTRPISNHLDRASLVNKGIIRWENILPAHGARHIIKNNNEFVMACLTNSQRANKL